MPKTKASTLPIEEEKLDNLDLNLHKTQGGCNPLKDTNAANNHLQDSLGKPMRKPQNQSLTCGDQQDLEGRSMQVISDITREIQKVLFRVVVLIHRSYSSCIASQQDSSGTSC